jgi:hypothetical protein
MQAIVFLVKQWIFNLKRSLSARLKCLTGLFFMAEKSTFVPPNRGVEQLVARWAHNPKVACSSHAPATKSKETKTGLFFILIQSGFLVEHRIRHRGGRSVRSR